MSLLLDALKKAAKDKQNAAAQSGAEHEERVQEIDNQNDDDLVLTLDEPAEKEQADIEPDETTGDTDQPGTEPQELTIESVQAHTTTSTVSDEALQMLVYKTNREHRRRQKVVWGAVAAVSVCILLIGGYYFYDNMVKDIESLERKHRIAIQKVNAEVIKKKRPELIADLTDNTVIENKPIEQGPANKVGVKKPGTVTKKTADKAKASKKDKVNTPQFIRSKQADPVSDMLQQGWQAYNRADYDAATQLYQKVLQREADNRDALLGMAAIAMQKKQYSEAKSYYAKLLQLDPRDPIAVAALANLKQAEVTQQSTGGQQFSELSESKLKMLLKQQPDSAHINFALGNISAQQKKWPQAQAYYFDAWMADDNNPDYAFNLAVSLDQIGKAEQAARLYRRSLALANNHNHSFSVDAVKQRLKVLEQQQ